MESWVGQCCIYVSDLEGAVAFYDALGLPVSTRTDLGHTQEAVVANDARGGRLQLAWKVDDRRPIDMGNAFAKLRIATTKDATTTDPDGYEVELLDQAAEAPWIERFCLRASDVDRTAAFYRSLGFDARDGIVAHPERGGTFQLEPTPGGAPVDMGTSMWKLYVLTDDCEGLHAQALAAGAPEVMAPAPLDRWPVTVSFVADPDGYQIEIVEKHAS
jgi:lactoylglutathione lyase